MPDIDIDFADSRRDEVLDYIANKYGRENCGADHHLRHAGRQSGAA